MNFEFSRVKIVSVIFDEDYFYFLLSDGRRVGEPKSKYKRLSQASKEQLHNYVISDEGVHWVDIDEDIALESFLCAYHRSCYHCTRCRYVLDEDCK